MAEEKPDSAEARSELSDIDSNYVHELIDDDLASRPVGYVVALLACAVLATLVVYGAVRWMNSREGPDPSEAAVAAFAPDDPDQSGFTPAAPAGPIAPEFPPGIGGSMYKGTVVVGVVVAPDGTAKEVEVVKPFQASLDAIAVKTARNLAYRPATRDGKPVEGRILVEVPFEPF